MSKLRFRVVETAFKKKAVEVATPVERPYRTESTIA